MAIWTLLWTTIALIIHLLTRGHDLPLALARRVWAPGVLATMGASLKVRGVAELDLSRPYLFVANHTSQLDIPVLFAALPVPLRFLSKQELRRVPLVGRFMAAMGMVFIDRGDSQAARHSIEEVAASLAAGNGLMAFPEGTRSPDGELQEFKTGAFVAAIKAGAAVVPVYIRGASAVLPARSLEVHPGCVEVAIGSPVDSQGLRVAERRLLADRVRSELREMRSERR